MKILNSTFFILLFSIISFAQSDLPIIGKISDISGKKKVYILAETTDLRKAIQKIIEKDKSLDVVADSQDADFVLELKQISKNTPGQMPEDTAEMSVYFYNSNKRKVIAWSETKNKYKNKKFGFPQANEIFLTKEFLKDYKGDK